jgi:hypothetical protein
MSADRPAGPTGAPRVLLTFFVLIALTVAAGILAAHTVGQALAPRSADFIGFAVALLVLAAAVGVWVLWDPTRGPVLPLGLALVGGGTACVLLSVALQFYLVSLTNDQSRRLAELLSERQKLNQQGNINLNAPLPTSVEAVSYFALFGGLWLAATGVRVGIGRASIGPPPLPRPPGHADVPPV